MKKLFISFLLFFCFAIPSFATHFSSKHDGCWHFLVMPYYWSVNLDGHATVNGQRYDFTSKLRDSFELTNHINFGALVHLEAQKKRIAFLLDTIYLRLSPELKNKAVNIDSKIKTTLIDFGVFYSFIQYHDVLLEGLLGGRYLYFRYDINPSGNLLRAKQSETWTDPIIGARIRAPISKKLLLTLRGDIGGFGLGSSFDGHAVISADYAFTPYCSVMLGYRALHLNYNDHAALNRFSQKLTVYGPMVGLAIRF